MMASQPDISVIVPVYNTEEFLPACIESIIDQNIQLEIILVNDGSTDSSGEIAVSYKQKDDKIKVIHQKNKGLSVARNTGLNHSKGKYILFIDSDDWIEKDSLFVMYELAKKNNACIVMGGMIFRYPDGRIYEPFRELIRKHRQESMDGKIWFERLLQSGIYYLMVCNYMFDREWLIENEMYFESVIHEDELWTPTVLSKANKIVISDSGFYNYRQRENSIMHSLDNKLRFSSLIYIANRLVILAESESMFNYPVFTSWLWVDILRLYALAFSCLHRISYLSSLLPVNHFFRFAIARKKINDEILPVADWNFKSAKRELFTYYRNRNNLKDINSHYYTQTNLYKQFPDERTKFESNRNQINALFPTGKIILFYNTMWTAPLDIPVDSIPSDCIITTDRSDFRKADMVVFHLPSLIYELDHDLEKPDNQKWVAWSLESEDNYAFLKDPEFMDLFDYRMSYHQNADVVYPYYKFEYMEELLYMSELEFSKKKDICMLISSSFNKSKRQEYLKELMSYIRIDSYGKICNNMKLENDSGNSSKMELYKNYKFVIAFENSTTTDYVTEKFFDPLLAGSVPIYMGAPNISEFSPGKNCFIDIRKFNSPKQLAQYLHQLCRNEKDYNNYFDWKYKPLSSSFLSKLEQQRIHPFIRLFQLVSDSFSENQ